MALKERFWSLFEDDVEVSIESNENVIVLDKARLKQNLAKGWEPHRKVIGSDRSLITKDEQRDTASRLMKLIEETSR